MDIISLVLTLAILGFCVWLLITYVPMPDVLQKVIIAIVAIAMIGFMLRGLHLGALH